MNLKLFILFSTFGFVFSACVQKPKACLNLDDTYETGREYRLESCSENFDFLTWDFGDNSGGFIGEIAPHTFYEQGTYYLKLMAYSDGAYRSDEVVQAVKSSRRYLSHFEVIGESNYSRFRLNFDNIQIEGSNANGNFTESLPYSHQIWPGQSVPIPLSKVKLGFMGIKNGSASTIVPSNIFNFETNVDNPIVLENEDFTVNVYWSYQ